MEFRLLMIADHQLISLVIKIGLCCLPFLMVTYDYQWILSFVLFHTFSHLRFFLSLASFVSRSYQGWGVVNLTHTLWHEACLSRQSVGQSLYIWSSSSICHSSLHSHLKLGLICLLPLSRPTDNKLFSLSAVFRRIWHSDFLERVPNDTTLSFKQPNAASKHEKKNKTYLHMVPSAQVTSWHAVYIHDYMNINI